MAPIEFWFDLSSPYSYIASHWIGPLAQRHGRTVDWKPLLLGAAFKATGLPVLVDTPLKGGYSRRDFERSARFAGVPYRQPEPFPISTVLAARGVLWLQRTAPALAEPFIHAAFRAYFVDNHDLSEPRELARIAGDARIDAAAFAAAVQQPELKDALRKHMDAALARGVFGAPYIVIDGEPFWGNDRQSQVERWLASGPF
jgi:2-hydroxychromene-2-carboxylate isomerase